MPQNAIIRANGTGDYTTPQAWEAAEQNSDYGSITTGRLDGFFDVGGTTLEFNGAWVNGARLEAFDSADGFNGVIRSLCGIQSTVRTIRNRAHNIELEGLEVISTSASLPAYGNTTGGGDFSVLNCLFKSVFSESIIASTTAGSGIVNCVLDSTRGYRPPIKLVNSSVFADSASSVGTSSSAGTADNTVTVNLQSGACYRGTITQSNNASTDTTADTLDNIVIANEFVSATPVASGDYRILSTGDLASNVIGAFIQSGGGGISGTITETGPSFTEAVSATLTASINASIVESGPSFTESISTTLSVNITSTITEVGPSFTESINATVTSTTAIIASIAEQGPSFTESIAANLDVNISATITELGPSFTESINISLTKDITVSITESGPSFTESIIATLPVVITVNPKNIISVKRKSNNVIIKRSTNKIIVKRNSNIIRVK